MRHLKAGTLKRTLLGGTLGSCAWISCALGGCASGAAGSGPTVGTGAMPSAVLAETVSTETALTETALTETALTETASVEKTNRAFSWPEGKTAAVSLTYDDAIASQRTHAASQLVEFGLTGTFFLKGASEDLLAHREQWQALLSAGHELASHTMHHPCDRKFDWVPKGYASQDYDLLRMRRELEESRELLQQLGAPSPYTFAYPCGEQTVGETKQSYAGLVRELFLAARGFQSRSVKIGSEDLHDLPTVDGAQPIEKLLKWVAQAQAAGDWLVITFHGVGGDYLSVDLEAHRRLLSELKERSPQLWVAPFGRVAAHIRSQKQ